MVSNAEERGYRVLTRSLRQVSERVVLRATEKEFCRRCTRMHADAPVLLVASRPSQGAIRAGDPSWRQGRKRSAVAAGTNPYGGASRVPAPQSNGSEFAMRSGWA